MDPTEFFLRMTLSRTALSNTILVKRERESEVTQSCPTLCNPMNHSTPGLPVHHQLLFAYYGLCCYEHLCANFCVSLFLILLGACVPAKSLQSCPILCDPMNCSLPGSSVHGILQVRLLEWVAMPSSRGSSWPRDQTQISCSCCIAGRFFTVWATNKY